MRITVTVLLLIILTGKALLAQSGPEWAAVGHNAMLADISGDRSGIVVAGWTGAAGMLSGRTLPHTDASASLLLCLTESDEQCWVRNGQYSHPDHGSLLTAFHVDVAGGGYVYSTEGFPFAVDSGMHAAGGVTLNRYAPDGASIWTVPIGNAGNQHLADWLAFARGIGTDVQGNLYFTGIFRDTLTIGATTVLGSERETFIGSLDPDGSLRWLRPTGGPPDFEHPRHTEDGADPFAVDRAGNTYIGGFYPEGKVFAVEGPHHLQLERDANVIVSFDADGRLRWIRADEGEGLDMGPGVSLLRLAAGRDGNVLAAWDAGTSNVQVGDSPVSGGVFVTMLDADGDIQWMRRQNSQDGEFITAVNFNDDGDVLIAGSFAGRSLDLDGTRYTQPQDSDRDGFAALYRSTGELQWSTHASGPAITGVTAAAFDSSGHIYLSGVFTDEMGVGDDVLTGSPGQNTFLLKYNATVLTSTDSRLATPLEKMLSAPYPNPAAETAVLSYSLSEPDEVTAALFDVLGRRVAVLDGGSKGTGIHQIRFDASNLSPGVYVVHLHAGDRRDTRTVVVR